MKITFLNITILLIISIAILSCKKDKSNSPNNYSTGTITATINDTNVAFNFNNYAFRYTAPGYYYSITISGVNLVNKNESLTLKVNSNNKIGDSLYTENSYINNAAGVYQLGSFQIPGSIVSTYYNFNGYQQIGYGSQHAVMPNPLNIIVTSIDTTSIQGTFQGELFLNGDSTVQPIRITNGNFNVKYLN
jgi:hypothetical protein